MAVKPLWVSKVNTTAQIVLIAFVLGERSGVDVFQPLIGVTVLAVAALTVASAGAYLVEWVRHMAGGPGDVERARAHEPTAAGGLLDRRAPRSCCSSSGCSATSCCPSSWAWRSPICSIRSPTGCERSGMSRFWATITIVDPHGAGPGAGRAHRRAAAGRASSPASSSGCPPTPRSLQALGNRFFQTRIGQLLRHRRSGGRTSTRWCRRALSWIATVIASVWAGGQALISVVSLIVVTPVVAFYLLYDWDRMLDARRRAAAARARRDDPHASARDINIAIAGFIRGQGAVCLILGLFYAISLSLLGLNFGFLIGSVAGLISFIPVRRLDRRLRALGRRGARAVLAGLALDRCVVAASSRSGSSSKATSCSRGSSDRASACIRSG